MNQAAQHESKLLPREDLQRLIDTLRDNGYDVIGPTVQQHAVVYRSLTSVSQLPQGWSDMQSPAVYRLKQENHGRYFAFNSSPDSWKRWLFPTASEIGTATLRDGTWHFENPSGKTPRYAFLGVRACDLAAIAVQDRVFSENAYVDAAYTARRNAALIIVVQCSTAASTCFCTSMGTGPQCDAGYDLRLTEIDDGFVMNAGTPRGFELIDQLQLDSADDDAVTLALDEVENARQAISKRLDVQGIHDLLLDNLEHPQWKLVAERCLSCTNCTMVCPTCFCSTVEEVANLSQSEVSRVRNWDSCFNIQFSYTAGGTVRNDTRSRYRQWLTHKFATWQDQFDVSGCVGCGRCITWCPVGIDVTEEIKAFQKPSVGLQNADDLGTAQLQPLRREQHDQAEQQDNQPTD
jgi:sulfhydrogenase subunit beta (sulfur reductase)